MKKIIIIVTFLSLSIGVRAQGPPDDDRAESLRIAFLTRHLSLTSAESQQFWPVYNQMREEAKVVMDAKRAREEAADFENMSNDQLKKFIQDQLDSEQQMLSIRKKYMDQFLQVLPTKKVAMLSGAEESFRRELLRFARDRQDRPDGPPEGDRKKPGGHPGNHPIPAPGF